MKSSDSVTGKRRIMNSLVSIAILTVQKCLRSHIFQLVFIVILFGNVFLILSLEGDGTAVGYFQILVSYTFSFTGYLLAFTAIWLGCFVAAGDIDKKQIQMVLSKPVMKVQFLLGKLAGVCLLQFVLLSLISVMIGLTLFAKLNRKNYPDHDIQRLRKNVLTASRRYSPLANTISTPARDELEEGQKRLIEIPIYTFKTWNFNKLPNLEKNDTLQLRYRMYLNSPNSDDQRSTQGIWWINNPLDKMYYPIPLVVHTGKIQEISLPAEAVSSTGELKIRYENQDQGTQSMLIPQIDGPFIFIPKSSFGNNYVRMVLMIFFKLIFSSIIGITAGSLFSLPMAIFFATSYLIIGVLIVFMRSTFPEISGSLNFLSQAACHIRMLVGYATIDLRQFYVTDLLMRGEFIELSKISIVFAKTIMIHGTLIFLTGSYFFQKRELGA